MEFEAHESAHLHVTGGARYVDDLGVADVLHGLVYTSPHAHACILSFDLAKAREAAGVHAILSYEDIPGENNIGPVIHDEPTLAEGWVHYVGQAIFIIAAEGPESARAAAALIDIEFEVLPPILTLEEAMDKGELMHPERKIARGDATTALRTSPMVEKGTLETGAQEHWYLETQVAIAIPGEMDEMTVWSSTQHPSETQALIAEALDIPKMEVVVQVRRMGGAFGGKETQANHVAVWSALLAKVTGRPVKIRLFRDDDQIITGKRHPFLIEYEVGYDDEGLIYGLDVVLNVNAGWASDLTMAVLERGMMHAENCYYIPNIHIIGRAWKTNVTSHTAFRGFGGPQGVAGIEQIIDHVARSLQKDPLEIRTKNFYQETARNITPYDQVVERNRLGPLLTEIVKNSEYYKRREAVHAYNQAHRFKKRGMALTPVKFGISFTTSFLNQAGALVNIYKDGSVAVNHGGTEMGQGLHTKIKRIAALELGVTLDSIKVTATNTGKVPNTSATAASAGTDLNGMAVKHAIDQLKERIAGYLAGHFTESFPDRPSLAEDIRFENDEVFDAKGPSRKMAFKEAVMQAYLNQVSLSATGFYKTPDIHFDREKGKGKPYHYFAFGMAVTEVEVDVLTGHVDLLRADIVHDVGSSINERIDIGQIEGAYIQGVGWCTTEDCKWDAQGNLLNHSPDTYKIPSIQDVPPVFNVALLREAPNAHTIRNSKAVAEPPFMHGLSCWLAIKDAISAVHDHGIEPQLPIPATNEAIVLTLEQMKELTLQKV